MPLDQSILEAAVMGLEAQKREIDAKMTELRLMLDGNRPATTAMPVKAGGRRRLSAAARSRIAEAQRRRWAKVRGGAQPSGPAARHEVPKPKRKMSAKGRRAIAEATRKRWAAFRAAKAQQKRGGAKKAAAK